MITREEYHQRRLSRAKAAAMECFYACHGDEDEWQDWEFEAEKKLLEEVTTRINKEDGIIY